METKFETELFSEKNDQVTPAQFRDEYHQLLNKLKNNEKTDELKQEFNKLRKEVADAKLEWAYIIMPIDEIMEGQYTMDWNATPGVNSAIDLAFLMRKILGVTNTNPQLSDPKDNKKEEFGINFDEDPLISLKELYYLYECLESKEDFYKDLGIDCSNVTLPKAFDEDFISDFLANKTKEPPNILQSISGTEPSEEVSQDSSSSENDVINQSDGLNASIPPQLKLDYQAALSQLKTTKDAQKDEVKKHVNDIIRQIEVINNENPSSIKLTEILIATHELLTKKGEEQLKEFSKLTAEVTTIADEETQEFTQKSSLWKVLGVSMMTLGALIAAVGVACLTTGAGVAPGAGLLSAGGAVASMGVSFFYKSCSAKNTGTALKDLSGSMNKLSTANLK